MVKFLVKWERILDDLFKKIIKEHALRPSGFIVVLVWILLAIILFLLQQVFWLLAIIKNMAIFLGNFFCFIFLCDIQEKKKKICDWRQSHPFVRLCFYSIIKQEKIIDHFRRLSVMLFLTMLMLGLNGILCRSQLMFLIQIWIFFCFCSMVLFLVRRFYLLSVSSLELRDSFHKELVMQVVGKIIEDPKCFQDVIKHFNSKDRQIISELVTKITSKLPEDF